MDKKTKLALIALSALILPAVSVDAQAKAAGKSKDVSSASMSDELALRKQARDYETYFAAADAHALANMWTTDGTYIDATGTEYRGRASIEKTLTDLFKEIGKQPLSISVETIRFPAPTVAVETGTSQTKKGLIQSLIAHYTVTHVKRDGVWLMDAVQETIEQQPQPAVPASQMPAISWMVGDWTATGKRGIAHLHNEWLPNHNQNFLSCRYSIDSDEKNDDLQVFGWNPRSSQIDVWHFAPNGGVGRGKMIAVAPGTWIERASNVEPDGTTSSADYRFKKIDDNTFSWQSIHRSHGSTALPDLPPITITRNIGK